MSRDTLRETGELFNHLTDVLNTKPYTSALRSINTQIVGLNALRLDLSKLLKLAELTRETLDIHPFEGGAAWMERPHVPRRVKDGREAKYFFSTSQFVVLTNEIRGCLDGICVTSKEIQVQATSLHQEVDRLAKDLRKVVAGSK
tara:strand:+ start:287 stop:718 length:432 start_codon:yes stop_codon:yes gene_type:complete